MKSLWRFVLVVILAPLIVVAAALAIMVLFISDLSELGTEEREW